jgi:hypothetical protein
MTTTTGKDSNNLTASLQQRHATISPKDSGGGVSGKSVDVNSNGTVVFSTGSPEVKGSITSRSDICYPVIDTRSKIYESFQDRKIIRFLTVIAYIFFVSLGAIVLSLYYFFIWDPRMESRVVPEGAVLPIGLLNPPSLHGGPETVKFGRKGHRVTISQHNMHQYPINIDASPPFLNPHPSPDTMVPFPVQTAKPVSSTSNGGDDSSNCDNSSPASPSDESSVPPGTFAEDPSPPSSASLLSESSAVQQQPKGGGRTREFLPTAPSIYSLIVRRFENKKSMIGGGSNFVTSPSTSHLLASS